MSVLLYTVPMLICCCINLLYASQRSFSEPFSRYYDYILLNSLTVCFTDLLFYTESSPHSGTIYASLDRLIYLLLPLIYLDTFPRREIDLVVISLEGEIDELFLLKQMKIGKTWTILVSFSIWCLYIYIYPGSESGPIYWPFALNFRRASAKRSNMLLLENIKEDFTFHQWLHFLAEQGINIRGPTRIDNVRCCVGKRRLFQKIQWFLFT